MKRTDLVRDELNKLVHTGIPRQSDPHRIDPHCVSNAAGYCHHIRVVCHIVR